MVVLAMVTARVVVRLGWFGRVANRAIMEAVEGTNGSATSRVVEAVVGGGDGEMGKIEALP